MVEARSVIDRAMGIPLALDVLKLICRYSLQSDWKKMFL